MGLASLKEETPESLKVNTILQEELSRVKEVRKVLESGGKGKICSPPKSRKSSVAEKGELGMVTKEKPVMATFPCNGKPWALSLCNRHMT